MAAEPAESADLAPLQSSSSSSSSDSSRDVVVVHHRQTRLSTRTRECISFSSPGLLRGTKAAAVLHGFGALLGSSQGDEGTFERSDPVTHIDYFISHNWSTRRFGKFMALALHFNLCAAVAASLAMCCLAASLTLAGVLPMREFEWKGRTFKQGMGCHFLGSATFFVTLLLWHEIGAFLGTSAVVFLDKTCIHQTDASLKRQGICSLAAFLAKSRSLLIVYSDLYLQRLWTVYELASNLVLHPSGTIRVIPIFLPKLVLRGIVFWFLFTTIQILASLHTLWDALERHTFSADTYDREKLSHYLQMAVSLSLLLPATFALMLTQRKWARKRASIKHIVQGFSITRAACFCEDDRPVVQGNIASFMRDLELVPKEASEETALAAFDQLVREEVPHGLAASFGRAGIPYRYAATIFMAQSLRIADQVTPLIQGGLGVGAFFADASMHLTMHFALLPLGIAAFDLAVSQCLGEGLRPALVFCVLYCLIFLSVCVLWQALDTLANSAKASLAFVPPYVCLVLLLFCMVRLAFRPLAPRRVQRSALGDIKQASSFSMRACRRVLSSRSRSSSSSSEASIATEGHVAVEEESLPCTELCAGRARRFRE